MNCVGEPISWLRLEQHAIARDAKVDAHVESCPACRACLNEITGDLVALKPLPVTAPPPRKWWVIPAFAFAAAALVLLVIAWPRGGNKRENVVAWKGGELVLGTIRERAGAIVEDAPTFRIGDRWKVVVTCEPGNTASIWVEVYEVGGYSAAPDHPLEAADVACGNRIVVPGAFSLTGALPNRVCVRVDGETACTTIAPEK